MNKNPAVDQFLIEQDSPMLNELRRIREIILSTDDRVEETIKWKSPTFMFKGNIASFMKAKKLVTLMFHKGAEIHDPNRLLEGDGKEARVARFYDMNDVEAKKEALEKVIQEWIRMKGG